MKREGKKGEGKTEEPGRDAKRKEIKRRMERQGERVRIEEKKEKKVLNWIMFVCFASAKPSGQKYLDGHASPASGLGITLKLLDLLGEHLCLLGAGQPFILQETCS